MVDCVSVKTKSVVNPESHVDAHDPYVYGWNENENVMVSEDSIETLFRNLNLNRWILLLYFLT